MWNAISLGYCNYTRNHRVAQIRFHVERPEQCKGLNSFHVTRIALQNQKMLLFRDICGSN